MTIVGRRADPLAQPALSVEKQERRKFLRSIFEVRFSLITSTDGIMFFPSDKLALETKLINLALQQPTKQNLFAYRKPY